MPIDRKHNDMKMKTVLAIAVACMNPMYARTTKPAPGVKPKGRRYAAYKIPSGNGKFRPWRNQNGTYGGMTGKAFRRLEKTQRAEHRQRQAHAQARRAMTKMVTANG